MHGLRGFISPKTNYSDEHLTPPYIIRKLGQFDLDPCSPINRPWDTAKRHLTILDDGLTAPWGKDERVWLNSPYSNGQAFDWLERLAEHKLGIALIFARTETIGFQNEVWEKAHSIFFLRGQISFFRPDGTPSGGTGGAPSCLISYSEQDTDSINFSRLPGKLLQIRGQR